MNDAPERIWVIIEGKFIYSWRDENSYEPGRDRQYVPYRRVTTCVWEQYTARAYIRDCTDELGHDPETFCGNCGGRIEVKR